MDLKAALCVFAFLLLSSCGVDSLSAADDAQDYPVPPLAQTTDTVDVDIEPTVDDGDDNERGVSTIEDDFVTDFIGGVPLYINYDYNFRIKSYLNKRAVHYGTGYETVIVSCDTDLYNLRVYALTFTDAGEFKLQTDYDPVLFSIDRLSADSYFAYATTIPCGIPAEAISFDDEDGNNHSYILSCNGRDGSTCAFKMEIHDGADSD